MRSPVTFTLLASPGNPVVTSAAAVRRVRAPADRLEAEPACLPTFGRSRQDGRGHIEVGETY